MPSGSLADIGAGAERVADSGAVKRPLANLRSLNMLRVALAVSVLLGHCRWLLWAGHSHWMGRRLHRLGAAYAFALLVTIACDLAGRAWFPTLYAAATGDVLLDGVFSRTGYSWASVAPALVILPSSLGFDFGTNGPLWSLAYEVVYYALYPRGSCSAAVPPWPRSSSCPRRASWRHDGGPSRSGL